MPTTEISEVATVFGIIGSVSSQLMNLSAVPSMVQIFRAKSTLLYPAFPFIIGFVASWGGLAYCILTKQYVVVISTSFSMTFNACYLSIHLWFSRKRREILKLFGLIASVELVLVGTGPLVKCLLPDTDNCESFASTWIGSVNGFVYCVVYCGQLWSLRQVIRSKNSASLSPWMTAGVTFCSLMWTLYSIFVPDYFYLSSSLVGVLSALIQIFLLIKYPRNIDASLCNIFIEFACIL